MEAATEILISNLIHQRALTLQSLRRSKPSKQVTLVLYFNLLTLLGSLVTLAIPNPVLLAVSILVMLPRAVGCTLSHIVHQMPLHLLSCRCPSHPLCQYQRYPITDSSSP